MDEPFLSWWLIVLAGMWSIAITIWQSSTFRRETRLWAGLLATIYLSLIFVAFGSLSRGFTSSSLVNLRNFAMVGSVAASSIIFVWMFGQIGTQGRRLCYTLVLAANAGLCATLGATEIYLGLCAAAVLSAVSIVRAWRRTATLPLPGWLFEQLKITHESTVTSRQPGTDRLIGLTTAALTLALMGTVSYALRIESSRTAASPHSSSLPSREFLDRIHAHETAPPQLSAVMEYAFGHRPDIVVLIGSILFLGLASSLHGSREENVISDDKYSPS